MNMGGVFSPAHIHFPGKVEMGRGIDTFRLVYPFSERFGLDSDLQDLIIFSSSISAWLFLDFQRP
jgi:hypothetical protein